MDRKVKPSRWVPCVTRVSLLRRLAKFMPQVRDVRQQHSYHVFRKGTLVQADLLLSCKTHYWQGAFAPRKLPRFIATMPPSDYWSGT